MAISQLGTITLSQQDLGNILGVAATQAALQLAASQTNAALTGSLYTSASSPFFGLSLVYTSTTDVATNTITISLAAGSRTGWNARRLSRIVDIVQNFQSSGFLPNTAPNGQITEAP